MDQPAPRRLNSLPPPHPHHLLQPLLQQLTVVPSVGNTRPLRSLSNTAPWFRHRLLQFPTIRMELVTLIRRSSSSSRTWAKTPCTQVNKPHRRCSRPVCQRCNLPRCPLKPLLLVVQDTLEVHRLRRLYKVADTRANRWEKSKDTSSRDRCKEELWVVWPDWPVNSVKWA